jgi:hypothetical protein
MSYFTTALNTLRPNASWEVIDDCYDGLIWRDDNELPPPTEEEINQEIERIQQEYERNQYQRDRAAAYPSIQDQLDTLYHQGYDGWKAMVDEVKNKYPKPGEG